MIGAKRSREDTNDHQDTRSLGWRNRSYDGADTGRSRSVRQDSRMGHSVLGNRWLGEMGELFAPLLSQELPGNPTVVVKFMPGAGSTKGANWFQEQEDGDGTLLFGTSGSTQFPYLLDDPRVRYEYADWVPVMASGTGGVAYLNPTDGAKFDGSANNLKDIDFIFGSQGATRLDIVPLLAWEMLGMNVEPVFGIKGRGDGRLMFERGEATIDYQTSSSYIGASADLVEQEKPSR